MPDDETLAGNIEETLRLLAEGHKVRLDVTEFRLPEGSPLESVVVLLDEQRRSVFQAYARLFSLRRELGEQANRTVYVVRGGSITLIPIPSDEELSSVTPWTTTFSARVDLLVFGIVYAFADNESVFVPAAYIDQIQTLMAITESVVAVEDDVSGLMTLRFVGADSERVLTSMDEGKRAELLAIKHRLEVHGTAVLRMPLPQAIYIQALIRALGLRAELYELEEGRFKLEVPSTASAA